jgi:AcrR family transcriptional regulator
VLVCSYRYTLSRVTDGHYHRRSVGYRHSYDEILAGAVATATEHGLSKLSFGRVANELGIADRTVVYYFPTIEQLATAVLVEIGVRLQAMLEPVLVDRVADHRRLVRAAWPVLGDDRSDAIFALFFEANGLAVAGREPYRSVVTGLVGAWIDWVGQFIDAPEPRVEAETAIAVIDGLVLLRLLGGADAAERAARRLGVVD